MHFSLGAGVSAAAGPVGRVLEADMRAGDKGSGVCYTYSCSKGSSFVLACNFQLHVI
jgi:lipid-binding SYLF domain-containing protein